MLIFIFLTGVSCLGYGIFLKQQKSREEKELSHYQTQINEQTDDFRTQFKIGQDQLEQLYGKQLFQISKDIESINQRLAQIQDGMLPFELQEKEQQIRLLLDRGMSPSDIAKRLKISVTEVLVSNEK